jgi:hypothetical protein
VSHDGGDEDHHDDDSRKTKLQKNSPGIGKIRRKHSKLGVTTIVSRENVPFNQSIEKLCRNKKPGWFKRLVSIIVSVGLLCPVDFPSAMIHICFFQ